KSGWVAWTADGAALAFSGVLTEPQAKKAEQTEEKTPTEKTEQKGKETRKTKTGQNADLTAQNDAEFGGRIDFIDDAAAGVRYVDPRDGVFEGRSTPTLWLDGEIVPGWDAVDWEYGGKTGATRD
ncbi:MAG: hypothetical protein IJ387_07885, partial [Thermoguttaceae bacterium]|nr:hypothetical protein [Thermoguttaceae bacterium]